MTSHEPSIQNSDQVIDTIIEGHFSLCHSANNYREACSFIYHTMLKPLTNTGVIIVSLIGGAASGKSTVFGKNFLDVLSRNGLNAEMISTDDYVKGTREWRRANVEGKDPKLKYDFDDLNLRIERIRESRHSGATVPVPTYDEQTGTALAVGEANFTRKIGSVDVLIVEGDFDEVANSSLRLYLHVPDHIRLEYRIARDLARRGESDPEPIRENFYLRQRLQHFPITLCAAQRADAIIRRDGDISSEKCSIYMRPKD